MNEQQKVFDKTKRLRILINGKNIDIIIKELNVFTT